MKTKLIDKAGKAGKELDLPKIFSQKIRTDILAKVFEAQKKSEMQAYGAMKGAGAGYSASGIIKRKRHDWKTSYGKGISRVPRKIMSRSGASFNWIGATVSNTRGGRRPHAPRAEKNPFSKINKNELKIAYTSALSGTVDGASIQKKYPSTESGFVFSGEILGLKTKEFFTILKSLFGENESKILKVKKVRAGIGKMRGRKYKVSSGLLFVLASDEKMSRKGIKVVSVPELRISDLSPNGEPGRLTCYTEKAIKELGERFN
ncbi:50S ribosomal protein L4 [archaeon]|jgi:large subunit ribosomal protein L4e|nr:50S ribosomal protein L4 [archaeon]